MVAAQTLSSCVKTGLFFIEVHGVLIAVASLAAQTGLSSYELSCPMACSLSRPEELNPCPLHWEADSFVFIADSKPLDYQGKFLGIALTMYSLPW